MKKLIIFLVVVQTLIMAMYGLLLVRGYAISSLINENTASLMLLFETPEEYQFFLDLAEREGLTVMRPVHLDDTHIMIHTSDLSLGGRVELRSGRWPDDHANEFVSVIDTGEANQVGLIHNTTPGFNISITSIENTTNVVLHGMFFINSTDLEVVQSFVNELDTYIDRAELWSINHEIHIFSQITMIQVIEVVVMSLLLLICILATFINDAVHQLKQGSVLIIHGYSKFKIAQKLIFKLLATLLFAFVISYALLVGYVSLAGYLPFLSLISSSFILIYGCLFLVYLMAFATFMALYLFLVKTTHILKGKKPYGVLQLANYVSKIAFSCAILIFGSLAIHQLSELGHRLEAVSDWELAQNIHATSVYGVGQATDLAIDLDIMNRKLELYSSLTRDHQAFIMDSRNILFLDEGWMPYTDMDSAPPMELSPHGYRITISPNFLEFNPITAVNGIPIVEQIVDDAHVLNLLVPEQLVPYEAEILSLYLEYFYSSSVRIDNIYNAELGYTLNTTPIENLSINIIYVEDNQSYFAFDYQVRPETGNRIKDPIAVLYTGSVHPSRLSVIMGENFFFHTEAIDAYQAILPLLLEHDLSHVIRSTVSVFDQNGREIIALREQSIVTVGLIAVLIASSLMIVYVLLLNYFEKNKQRIVIKSITGYSFIKRHFNFLLIVLLGSVGVMVLLSLFLGWMVFLMGLAVVMVDFLAALAFERRLMSKSLVDIIKGGR